VSAGLIGFDPLSPAGWRSAGLDPDRPVVAALSSVDPTAPRGLWHVRVVARIADARAFAGWTVRIPRLDSIWRADAADPGAPSLAAMLGVNPAAEAALARDLGARGTIAVGAATAAGVLVFVRRSGPHAVVDAFASAAAARLSWSQDGEAIRALLGPPRRAFAAREGAAARVLAGSGLAAWGQPAGLLDAILAWTRPPSGCLALRDVAPRTALTDGAAALRLGSHQISLGLTLAHASGAPLASAFQTVDDGLAGANPRTGQILSASLFLAGTDRLRAIPRPALIEAGWVSLWHRARPCGQGVRAVLLGFAWPELSAQWLHDVAEVAPQAAVLIGALRNVGLSARSVSATDRRAWDAVLEASLAHAGRAPAEAILDAVFGGRTDERRPRPHTAWAGQVLHPYTALRGRRGTGGAVLGVGLGDRARAWRLGQPLYRPRRSAVLARMRGNTAALLEQLGPGLAARRPALAAIASALRPRVGSFDAAVTSRPDAIRVTATVRRR
jgi:hypothetical protein